MDSAIRIADGVHWIGVNDRTTDLFESIWPLPRGVSYNSYAIVDDKVAIIDTVKKTVFDVLLRKIKEVLPSGRGVDYLIVNHMEPDHAGSIALLREIFPAMTIIGNRKTLRFLKAFHGIDENVQAVGDGEQLNLGSHVLTFHLTPMVHWPETMMTHDSAGNILFSGDAFGGFGALDGGLFDDQVELDFYEDEILRYFANIVGKYAPMVVKAIDKLEGVAVEIICSTHGPVWRSDPAHIIDKYVRWSHQDAEEGVVLIYGTMYGNSEKMMEAVAQGLREESCCRLRIHDASRSHPSFIIRDAWRYRGLVVGGPTYDAGLFPPVERALRLLEHKKLKDRIAGVFGTYGWSGGGVKTIREIVEVCKWDLVEPVVEANCSPTADDLAACVALGRSVARKVREAAAG